MSKLQKSVAAEIETSIDIYSRWSRIYDWSSAAIIVSSIVLSFVAGINVELKLVENVLFSALIAGLPAVLLTTERTLKLRSRSEWFWGMLLEYQALDRAMERNEIDEHEASQRIDAIEERGNKAYPRLADPA